MFERTTYDALVIGARCAGAATAMLMARSGLRVLAIDRGEYGADALSTHALMRAGVLQLHRWGVLPKVVHPCEPPPFTMATISLRSPSDQLTASTRYMLRGAPSWTGCWWRQHLKRVPRFDTGMPSPDSSAAQAGACAARRFAIVKVASLRSRPVLSLVLTAWAQLSPDWSALWCAGRDVMQAPSRTATGPVCKCRGTTGTTRRA